MVGMVGVVVVGEVRGGRRGSGMGIGEGDAMRRGGGEYCWVMVCLMGPARLDLGRTTGELVLPLSLWRLRLLLDLAL